MIRTTSSTSIRTSSQQAEPARCRQPSCVMVRGSGAGGREKLGRQAEGLFQREGCGGPGSTQPRPSRSSELDRTVGDLQPAGGRGDVPRAGVQGSIDGEAG